MTADNLNDMIRQYAIESGEYVPPTELSASDVMQDVLADELEVSRTPDLSDKLAHADKAESIAEQLDVLADRADGLAAEDAADVTAAAVAQVSAESLHREFGTIMTANNLELKAESFESASAADPKAQLVALSRDARAVSTMVGGFSDNLRDFSTEGAIVQFLRQDKARLAKARTALEAANGELTAKKGELSKDAVEVPHDGLKRFLTVKGEQVHDAKAAIDHDIQWLRKAEAQVNKLAGEIGSALSSAHGEGDHSAVVEKLKHIAGAAADGLDADLLGNHTVGGGKRSGGEKADAKAAVISYVVGSFKAAPKSIALVIGGAAKGAAVGVIGGTTGGAIGGGIAAGGVGAALGAAAGAVPGAVIGAGVGGIHGAVKGRMQAEARIQGEYTKRVDGTDAKSVAGAGDLQKIAQSILSLTTATNFSMDGEVESAGEKLDGTPLEVGKAGRKALSAVSKLADVVYEHAVYLTVKSAQLLSAAADKA